MADLEGGGHGSKNSSEASFEELLDQFRASKSHILSNLKCADIHPPSSTPGAYELHADPLPLEQHMEVSRGVRTDRFFDLIDKGDIVRGHVRKKLPFALEGQIDSFVGLEKKRFISDLGVRCYMKITELDKNTSDQQVAYQDFQQGDVFKAVVIKVDREEGRVSVSLRGDRLEETQEHIRLGYEEHKRPPSPPFPCRDWDYRNDLDHDIGFHNPGCVRNLLQCVGIDSDGTKSLFSSTKNPPYPVEEYSDSLKKEQKRNYSMEFTKTGVGFMKKGKTKEALDCFNRALQVDGDNEETLVAKGALHANAGQYGLAVADFTQALTTKPKHKNASTYLAETEVTWARELEKTNLAMSCWHYKKALSEDPSHKEARERLAVVRELYRKETAAKRKKQKEERIIRKALHKVMKARKSGHRKHKSKAGKVKSSSHDRKHRSKKRRSHGDGHHHHGNSTKRSKSSHSSSSKSKHRKRDDSDSTVSTNGSSSSEEETSSSSSLSTWSSNDSYIDRESRDTPSLSPHHKVHSVRKPSPPHFSKYRDK